MIKYRICTTKEPCKAKEGKRCHLNPSSSCPYQGATVTIHDTKEQAYKQILKELK